MTPKEQAAMQHALEALENAYENGFLTGITGLKTIDIITAVREALAEQAEQEPVGVVEGSGEWGIAGVLVAGVPIGTKLYAAPVRTKDLTDDEINQIRDNVWCVENSLRDFARAVIAADREKNKC